MDVAGGRRTYLGRTIPYPEYIVSFYASSIPLLFFPATACGYSLMGKFSPDSIFKPNIEISGWFYLPISCDIGCIAASFCHITVSRLEFRNRRLYCLETSIERAGVDSERLWVEFWGIDVSPKFKGLPHAMSGQRRICCVPCRCRELRDVRSGTEVDSPI